MLTNNSFVLFFPTGIWRPEKMSADYEIYLIIATVVETLAFANFAKRVPGYGDL